MMSNTHNKPQIREKLLKFGAKNLTDSELLAILLRTGSTKKNVQQLSEEIVQILDKTYCENFESNVRKIHGIGLSKVSTILASIELGRRFFDISHNKIKHPSDVAPLIRHYAMRKQESFLCVSLTGANEIIAIRVVSIGILTKTIVHPREVFADPITDRAASIIVAHNHPSGQIHPSEEDILLTQRLAKAGNLLGIRVLDHLILNANGDYFSFIENSISF